MRTDEVETRRLTVDPKSPDPTAISEAAELIRAGKLVAFPTETVYGLGANALDTDAVRSIFTAKGRPSTNPVIVHVPDAGSALNLVSAWPETAERLAAAFWPGPLTLVLPRAAIVPDVVTGDGPTVAIRAPAHPVAQALLVASRVPIAAPSANRSSNLSPTTADHVLRTLRGRIDLVLDGGPTASGIESTVLSLAVEPPILLRPGPITRAQIESLIGQLAASLPSAAGENVALPSPGMLARHYAPRTPLEIGGADRVRELLDAGLRIAWLGFDTGSPFAADRLIYIPMSTDPTNYAALLYATLHACDDANVDRIVVTPPPDDDAWAAIRDRLTRAAAT